MKFKESETIELKASTAQLSRALESLCAFANTNLGTVFFGIGDSGHAVGQDVSDRTVRNITTDILSQIEPRIFPNIWVEDVQGKTVLKVELKAAPEKPYFYKGKAYKRVGTSNVYLSRYEIEKYLYERDNPAYHYDKTIAAGYSGGIKRDRLEWFLGKAREGRNLPVDDFSSEKVTLEKLGLFTGGQLNFSGVLAFGTDIPLTLPHAYVKCASFEGTDKTGKILDHADIKEDVFRQIDLAEAFILRNIRKSAEVDSETMRRETRYEVPHRAIREAVANAVAHRDYRIASTVDVALFDDRIEIWSPGSLPAGMTLDLLRKDHASVLRNAALAEMLYLAGYIEHWGTGIRNMQTWMREYGLSEPEYREDGLSFVTVLKRKQAAAHPASTMQAPCKYHASIMQVKKALEFCLSPQKRGDIQQHLDLKNRDHFRKTILNPMVEEELLALTVPDKPKSPKQHYMTTDKGKQLLKASEKDS